MSAEEVAHGKDPLWRAAEVQSAPFYDASAGSFIAMDGRVWHTSGANVTG
ncbi:hypothetical protein OG225_17240 [Nocardia sp. NBC_01377]